MSADSLINRHRPTKFSQIIGQKDVVESFQAALADKTSHAFLFYGPSGCGKTTISRLGAKAVGAKNNSDLIEVDAATYSGVDDFRNLTATLSYRPLGTVKAVIIDEAHRLSKQAWDSALKSVEEPPSWVYWFFCSTEPVRVPSTIKSRCSSYELKPVRASELFELLEKVCEKEGFDTPNSILDLCAKSANGSPRLALSLLSKCYNIRDRKQASVLVASYEIEEGGNGFALAQALANADTLVKIQPILESIVEAEENPESVRHTINAYFAKVFVGNSDPKIACAVLKILDAFEKPFDQSEGYAPLALAVGRILYA